MRLFGTTSLVVCRILLISFGILMFSAATNAEEQIDGSQKTRDANARSAVVYVIDKSSSMAPIFDDVRETLKKAIRRCPSGDSLSLLLFGDSLTTLAVYKSMDDKKKATLIDLLDSVTAEDTYTNLGAAVKRGTEYLHEYFGKDNIKNFTMILVTDGKSHPSARYALDCTLDDAITQFPDFLPGKQWSLRYIVLASQIDPELLAVVQKYEGSFYDIESIAQATNTREEEVLDRIIEDPEKWEPLEAAVIDHLGEVLIRRFGQDTWTAVPKDKTHRLFPGDEIMVAPASEAVISFGQLGKAGVKEDSMIIMKTLQRLPARETSLINFRLERGTLWNVLDTPSSVPFTYEVLTPIFCSGIRGTILRVALDELGLGHSIAVLEGHVEITSLEERPAFEGFSMEAGNYSVIQPGKEPSPPGPIPDGILLEWFRWKQVLRGGVLLGDSISELIRILVTGVSKSSLDLGPLEPGGQCSDRTELQFDEPVLLEALDIRVRPDITLPTGVSCEARIAASTSLSKEARVDVTATATTDADFKEGATWEGKLIFHSSRALLDLSEEAIQLRIHAARAKKKVSWTTAFPGFYRKLGVWEWLQRHRETIVLCIITIYYLAIGAVVLKYLRTRNSERKFRSIEGWLVVLEKPRKSDIENIDLKALSERLKKSSLVIGRSSASDIRIPHRSVDRRHGEIHAGTEGKPPPVYIRGLQLSDVKVNNFVIDTETTLNDRDIVGIGEFQFLYSNSHMKQVVVHYRDGDVKMGVLQTWNIEDTGFALKPEGEYASEFMLYIPFEELKGIFFVKDFDKEIARKIKSTATYAKKTHVIVEFFDGEIIEGHTIQEYNPNALRFFLVPESDKGKDENNVYILVEKKATKRVQVLTETRE